MVKAKRTVKPLKDSGKIILYFRLGRTLGGEVRSNSVLLVFWDYL